MNKKYNLKLDLQFRCNNSIMKFNQFDDNTSDFFMRITNAGNLFDVEKAMVVLAVIKPSGKVASQFVEVENGLIYADLKPNMRDEIGIYTAQAMLILEDERIVTDAISYEVEENKIFALLNDTTTSTEEFILLTDMLSRLSTIEISEEQRMINESERILAEENRKIEEAKRVEAELIRQHEEADRSKYEATRENNENIRKLNEVTRQTNEDIRIQNEANRIDAEDKRIKAEQLRKDNYNFMTEDEERRRLEANAHKEAENSRIQAETNRVNEEAKRRTTEQTRVLAENTRVSNENTRKSNEIFRENNETQRIEAETQRQSRYNSFISEAEANANNFENYTNTAKVKEEERKTNELDRKSQEDKRVSNEVERISNENSRKANEVVREKNEASRQNTFTNKVNEVDKKIVEMNTAKDNFISSVNTKVNNKISEIDTAKSDMTNTVTNKIDEVENRFNALTSKQQQDAEVIDARDGEVSLKARLDRDIEKAKQVYVNVEGSHISTDSSNGYLKDVEILGNTIQDASNLADIRSVGDKVEGQELYEIPVLSCGKNLINPKLETGSIADSTGDFGSNTNYTCDQTYYKVKPNTSYVFTCNTNRDKVYLYDKDKNFIQFINIASNNVFSTTVNTEYLRYRFRNPNPETIGEIQLEEGTQATPYEPYQEDKLTILSPTPLEKVGDVEDRIVEKDGVWGVEKNIYTELLNGQYNFEKGNISENTAIYQRLFSNLKANSNDITCILSDKFLGVKNNDWVLDKESVFLNSEGYVQFRVNHTTIGDMNFDEYTTENNILFKAQLREPQFIPLPHDQQVKLRTFANKTNISFLTEVEGTIKAQVPKSLGATVNTHTNQIDNLNKELDRVKKLEDSTVSTVETESDFTTVEATSNGYFEDVKLEGKTLVNLCPTINKQYNSIGRAISNGVTVIGEVPSDNTHKITLEYSRRSDGTIIWLDLTTDGNGFVKIIKDIAKIHQIYFNGSNPSDYSKYKFLILEGDHTQNPPSYFEGLKSVGQDVDEIVVSSVNENLFDGDRELFVSSIQTWEYFGTPIPINKVEDGFYFSYELKSDAPFTTSSNHSCIRIEFYSSNGSVGNIVQSSSVIDVTTEYKRFEYYIPNVDTDKAKSIRFVARNTDGKNLYIRNIKISTVDNSYTSHQSDKKRLLFYNNETQTWEKPILREWDSIEKYANGKYYYHQRSGEEGYTKGDESVSDYITDMTTTVKPLAQEKVYECTNIDLITYANETNYIVESGAIAPKTTLKVHNNISNVVSLLQKKVSLLESNITRYTITQNRLMLTSRYNADTVGFKVDVASYNNSFEYDNDLYELILNNILVGKDNYDREYIENLIIFYWMDFVISDEMHSTLFEIIEEQHNPKIVEDQEEAPLI